jgi:hypothetical protein
MDDPGTMQQVKDGAADVAGTATDEIKHVAGEAAEQARTLAGTFTEQVEQQSRTGLESLVSTITRFAEDLEAMAEGQGGRDGTAADLVRQVSDRAQGLSGSLRDREPGDLVRTVQSYGRTHPGTFLLAAAAAGAATGRLTKAALAADPKQPASVDLRDRSASPPMRTDASDLEAPGIGIPGMGMPGGGGPGSLGAAGLEDDLRTERGNAPRTGAGQGLITEQGRLSDEWADEGISTADDMRGGTAQFPLVDEALEKSDYGRLKGPEVQP